MRTLREMLDRLLVAERLFHAAVIWSSISMLAAVVSDNSWATYAMGAGLAIFTILTLAVGLYLLGGAFVGQLSDNPSYRNRLVQSPRKSNRMIEGRRPLPQGKIRGRSGAI